MFQNRSSKKPCPPGEEASEHARPKGRAKRKGKKIPPFKKGGVMAGPLGKALLGK